MTITIKDGWGLTKIVLGLVLAAAVVVATMLGYRYITERYLVSSDADGKATARVVTATLFDRADLRIGRLSGVVQGAGQDSRWWGWLNSSHVVKAPFTVDYFIPLKQLKARDMRYDVDRQVLFVTLPPVRPEPANIDMANTTLDQTRGVFVTTDAMRALARKVAASAQREASARAASADNMTKVRGFARQAVERLFGGALGAAGVPARVEVRFADEPRLSSEQMDRTRTIAEVLRDPADKGR